MSKVLNKISILLGVLKFKGEKPSEKVLSTPVVSVGVKGTEFTTGVAKDSSSFVDMREGEILFFSDDVKTIRAGSKLLYDVLVGEREVEVQIEKFLSQGNERIKTRKEEVFESIQKIVMKRIEKYDQIVSEIKSLSDKDEFEKAAFSVIGESALKGCILETNKFVTGIGEKLPDEIEKRIEKVFDKWRKIEEEVVKKFEEKVRKIEEQMQKKKQKIEKKIREFEKKF